MVLGSVHCLSGDHSIFDPDDAPDLADEAWDDYFAAPRRCRASTAATTSSRTRCGSPSAGPRCPRDLARAPRPAGRTGRRERHGARGQRLGRALLPRARAAAVRVDRARRRAASASGSDAHRPARVGARAGRCRDAARGGRAHARWPSSTAAGATFPCDRPSAALGVRAARVRDQRVRALVPAARGRPARLRARHRHVRPHAHRRRRAGDRGARELRRAARLCARASR